MARKKDRNRTPRPKGAANPYGWAYQQERARLLSVTRICALQLVCQGAVADSADHVPPLARHTHVPGSGCCRLQPACTPCQNRQAALLQKGIDLTFPERRRAEPTRDW